jgi:hypothetical protein
LFPGDANSKTRQLYLIRVLRRKLDVIAHITQMLLHDSLNMFANDLLSSARRIAYDVAAGGDRRRDQDIQGACSKATLIEGVRAPLI